ncbi:MAG: hypothetical protein PSV16_06150 [Flavobacterium sp.]|nr:hypothetical protein [Flavobacterium sp.]
MKNTHRKYLIIFSIILISFFIRETALSNFNFYQTESSSKSEYQYSEKSLTIDLEDDGRNQINMFFQKNPYIILSGKDTIHYTSGYGEPLIWKIKKLKMDKGITPLYKNIKFDSEVVCKANVTITKLANNRLRSVQCNLDASIQISGNCEIIGLSSISNNKQIVNDLIVKASKENILKTLKTLDSKYGI